MKEKCIRAFRCAAFGRPCGTFLSIKGSGAMGNELLENITLPSGAPRGIGGRDSLISACASYSTARTLRKLTFSQLIRASERASKHAIPARVSSEFYRDSFSRAADLLEWKNFVSINCPVARDRAINSPSGWSAIFLIRYDYLYSKKYQCGFNTMWYIILTVLL